MALLSDAFLGDLVDALPARVPVLTPPDREGPALTAPVEIMREEAFTYAGLAAVPRLSSGPEGEVAGVTVGDQTCSLVERYEDPLTGFSAVRLLDALGEREVFAIGGTGNGSVVDIITNLDLGRPQAASPAYQAAVADARAAVLGGTDVVFTGASLGGALAQVAGYETAEVLPMAVTNPAAIPPGRVLVFGIDALGGRDAAESLNADGLDPAVLSRLEALNIRTEGDVVSRIGEPIGETATFPAVDRTGAPVSLGPDEAHVNVESLFTTLQSDALYATGVPGAPGEIGPVALLGNLIGPWISDVWEEMDLGTASERPESPRLPGTATTGSSGRILAIDANSDGAADLRLFYRSQPPLGAAADLVFG